MAIDLGLIEARLNLLQWRNAQLEAITDQLEKAFPLLVADIGDQVRQMSTLQIARAHIDPRPLTKRLLGPWTEKQDKIALKRAETSLVEVLATIPRDGAGVEHLRSAIPAVAGIGLIVASVAALPAVVSFATISATSFVVFSTSAVSTPMLLAGGAALAGVSFAGYNTLDYARQRSRIHLERRMIAMAAAIVLGHGLQPNAPCVLNKLQALVLKSGQQSLEEII